jgi:cation transport regulator ChaB
MIIGRGHHDLRADLRRAAHDEYADAEERRDDRHPDQRAVKALGTAQRGADGDAYGSDRAGERSRPPDDLPVCRDHLLGS